jgi:hypothetical protein
MKTQLKNVTLVIADCVDYARAYGVVSHCASLCSFGDIKLFTHLKTGFKYAVAIDRLNSVNEYSRFMLKDLANYVDTEFALIVQYDGFIVSPMMWSEEFLNYDYIGSPWHPEQLGKDVNPDYLVGNGGFSLRSKKLMQLTRDLPEFNQAGAEDVLICQTNRKRLEEEGMKFAPFNVAYRFGCENYLIGHSFGQHAYMTLHRSRNVVPEEHRPL